MIGAVAIVVLLGGICLVPLLVFVLSYNDSGSPPPPPPTGPPGHPYAYTKPICDTDPSGDAGAPMPGVPPARQGDIVRTCAGTSSDGSEIVFSVVLAAGSTSGLGLTFNVVWNDEGSREYLVDLDPYSGRVEAQYNGPSAPVCPGVLHHQPGSANYALAVDSNCLANPSEISWGVVTFYQGFDRQGDRLVTQDLAPDSGFVGPLTFEAKAASPSRP